MSFDNIGFDDNFDEDPEYDLNTIDPRLCVRMQVVDEDGDVTYFPDRCPFNECGRPCLDCDIILHPDDLLFDLKHLGIDIEDE